MNRSRTFATVVIGLFVAAAPLATCAQAGDYVVVGAVNRIADRCAAQYGPGFFDNGNGVCSRVVNHARIYVPSRNVGMNVWSSGAASNAAVISADRNSIVPVMPTEHLRVRGNLDSYNPFR